MTCLSPFLSNNEIYYFFFDVSAEIFLCLVKVSCISGAGIYVLPGVWFKY
jgi:hypothetical protein